MVSSGVAIAAAGDDDPDGGSSEEEEEDNNREHREAGRPDARRPGRLAAREEQPNQEEEADAEPNTADDLEDMSWWEALTPGQQRSMMRRFIVAPPAAAATAPSRIIVPAEQPRRVKRKKLLISDFHGKAGESVEAWLASVLTEAENQAHLGGDEWTVNDLYHGAVQHLKGKAQKWFFSWSRHVKPEEETFPYLVKKMRGKYGRRGNAFQVQQRLSQRKQQPGERLSDFADSLVDIGFGHNVSDEIYKEAFLSGMNNEVMATQIRTSRPETLEDALQAAIETCGEYGEGLSVTSWKAAQRRYRPGQDTAAEDSGPKRKAAKAEMASQFDWRQLGLGAGLETQPMYDTSGEAISGLAEIAKKDPLSLAALRALMVSVGVGDKTAETAEQNTKSAASKGKARALEVKAERTVVAAAEEPTAAAGRGWLAQPADAGGRGFGSRWGRGGRGRGRGAGIERYGPVDNRPIAQRKAESSCSYCGRSGHWWRECATRLAADNATAEQQAEADSRRRGNNQGDPDEEASPAAPAQGNAQRQ